MYRPVVPDRRLYATDAIVLSRFDYGEADRVLTLITPELGKLKAIAKGVRRPTSRLGGSVEPFAELHLNLARGRTFDVVTGVSVGRAFLRLRDSLEATATAWYSPSWRTARSRSATRPSRSTCCCAGPTSCSRPAWHRVGSPAGTRCTSPTSSACGPRSTAASSATGCSRPTNGSAGCRRSAGCSASVARARRTAPAGLSLEALKVLKAYQRMDVEALAALRIPPPVEREVEEASAFVRHALEREARSRRFLDEVSGRRRAAGPEIGRRRGPGGPARARPVGGGTR